MKILLLSKRLFFSKGPHDLNVSSYLGLTEQTMHKKASHNKSNSLSKTGLEKRVQLAGNKS